MPNRIIYYRKANNAFARKLRNESTYAEALLWKYMRKTSLGVQFHRQVPLNKFIVDFYCHELKLAVEIDGITHEGDEAIQRDEVRQKRLEDLGVVFIRLFDNDVKVNTKGCFIALQAKVDELLVEKRSQYSKRTFP